MTAQFLECIDWSRPWLAHVRQIGEDIANAPDWRAELNKRSAESDLRNRLGLPICFVPQADLPVGVAYETFIHDTGNVPTRDNLHDFFNALIWLTFPQIKIQLNALQAAEIERSLSSNVSPRGKLRDAATIFDENAALLVTSRRDLVDALRAHAWEDVFLEQGAAFTQECSVFLFGHALMEKLVAPYKSITGHMWVVQVGDQSFDFCSIPSQDRPHCIDGQVAHQLAKGLTTGDFSPLPILGIPGWWMGQDTLFYRDATVFRPKRAG